MNKSLDKTETLFILLSAWSVYASCQQDILLPLFGALFLAITYLAERWGVRLQTRLLKIPWLLFLVIIFFLGMAWRSVTPEPPNAVVYIPLLLPSLQAGSIIGALLILWRPDFRKKSYYLKLFAWGCVALSTNTIFDILSFIVLYLFFLTNTVFFLLRSFRRTHPARLNIPFLKRLGDYFWIILFLSLTISLFSATAIGIFLGDKAFMRIASDYFWPRHRHQFLQINQFLRISGPGYIGHNIRPVMRLDARGQEYQYLILQVFEDYDNGTWREVSGEGLTELPTETKRAHNMANMVLYDQFKNIIPAPRGVTAAIGKGGPFKKDKNGIITVASDYRSRKLTLLTSREPSQLYPKDTSRRALLSVPEALRPTMENHLQLAAVSGKKPFDAARAISAYFRNHFEYSMNTSFGADHQGLIKMLDQRKPAYCSYFATAMVMMLRAHGIPSRLVTGFLAQERIGAEQEYFLVRIRDAHAWVEALLPVGPDGGEQRWVRFDPTPSVSRLDLLNSFRPINALADEIWRSMLELRASLFNMDSEKIKWWFLWFLLIALLLNYGWKYIFGDAAIREKISKKPHRKGKKEPLAYLNYYTQYETLLKEHLKVVREYSETDTELVNRLQQLFPEKKHLPGKIHDFLLHYHAARFGDRDPSSTNTKMDTLVEDIRMELND